MIEKILSNKGKKSIVQMEGKIVHREGNEGSPKYQT